MNQKTRKEYFLKYSHSIFKILRQNLNFGKEEILLVGIIFIFLLINEFLLLSLITKKFLYVFLFQILFLLLENYLTAAVYSGIRKIIKKEQFLLKNILIEGLHFFFPFLFYKILIGISSGIILGICLGIINFIADKSLFYSTVVFILTVIWASFPFYFLILTLFTPFILVLENKDLLNSIKISFSFVRENLKYLTGLTLILAILWSICIFLLRVYNNYVGVKLLLFFTAGLLEIFMLKVFMCFYLKKGEENERNV